MELGQDGRCRVPGRIPLHHHASSLRGKDTGGRGEGERERELTVVTTLRKPSAFIFCYYNYTTCNYVGTLRINYVDYTKDVLYLHYTIIPLSFTHTHTQYNPQLVIVSCGFDAAEGDPLGGYHVTPAGYAHMTHLLSALANGKLVVAMEGGTYTCTSEFPQSLE